jgi:hypothetical protein
MQVPELLEFIRADPKAVDIFHPRHVESKARLSAYKDAPGSKTAVDKKVSDQYDSSNDTPVSSDEAESDSDA